MDSGRAGWVNPVLEEEGILRRIKTEDYDTHRVNYLNYSTGWKTATNSSVLVADLKHDYLVIRGSGFSSDWNFQMSASENNTIELLLTPRASRHGRVKPALLLRNRDHRRTRLSTNIKYITVHSWAAFN